MTLKPWDERDPLEILQRRGRDQVELARQQGRDARGVRLHRLELDAGEVVLGLVPPVRVDHEGRAGIGLVGFDLEGARADGRGRCRGGDAGGDVAGLQGAVGLHPFLVEDVDAGEIVEKKRVGAVGDDIDREVVDLFRLDHGREVAAGAGAGIEDAADRGDDVIRGEGIAVVELHVPAQLEAPGVRLHRLPAHRQRGLQLQSAAAAHQRIEDVVQHARREALRMGIGIERRDVRGRGPPQGLGLCRHPHQGAGGDGQAGSKSGFHVRPPKILWNGFIIGYNLRKSCIQRLRRQFRH